MRPFDPDEEARFEERLHKEEDIEAALVLLPVTESVDARYKRWKKERRDMADRKETAKMAAVCAALLLLVLFVLWLWPVATHAEAVRGLRGFLVMCVPVLGFATCTCGCLTCCIQS
jgi:Flp pilus assembly protein TadB